MNDSLSRDRIRTLIRKRRQALSPQDQTQAGLDLLNQIKKLPHIIRAKSIALYLSIDGEVDTTPSIKWLWQQNKQVLLPVIHPFSSGHLLFLNYLPTTPMLINQYGILEPILDKTQICPLSNIDIIFTPLVAFDESGQRLGMGGGYYDRTLEKSFETGEGAQAIGLAHNCQKVDTLPTQHWDIPLSIIVTPKQIWHWENNLKSL
ncbi:5-formyltetrahydrofolate cyclo-ligase [Vibrio sp. S17_S38]|uniref:5-formyltetrahydrofolate cyclo-ligase n=1 Tax=Vibrio sp. S17_S38 TaxID=2720229 RepID=UPI001680F771|nr:5-formyltetrahydrofolate cyclo-ligase [Vibrio sp. S17_S38]MBD1572413.1 5-formyltetrahydrofolate cyclo-ligase [Vibrio sp. S17_S38]